MVHQADPPVRALTLGLLATAAAVGLLAGVDPKVAVVGTLGLVFVVVVLGDLTAGLCIFTVVTFLDVLPFGGAAVTFAKAAGLLLAVSWLAQLTSERGERGDFLSAHPAFTYLLFAFVAWAATSLVWAEDPGEGLTSVYRYGLNFLVFVIVFTAVRSEQAITWVMTAFLAGALVSAAYGLAFAPEQSSASEISRLAGAGADPNELAAVLVTGLVLASAFVAGRWYSLPVRVLACGVIALCAAGVLLSFSRTGLVSLAVALIAAVAFGGRWRWAALLLLTSVTVGVATYLAYFAEPEQRQRVTKLDGGTGREDIWAVGWRMVEDSPSNGVGAGNFAVSSVHYLLEPGAIQRAEFIVDTPKVAHNVFLEVWAELGLIGLLMFLALVFFPLVLTWQGARLFQRAGNERMELLSRALLVAQLALLAAGLFLSEQYNKQLWLLLALGPCLAAVARSGLKRAPAPRS